MGYPVRNRIVILSVVALGFLVLATDTAQAVLPSGAGQTTKAHSLSVVVASDQTVPVSGTVTVDTSALATSANQVLTNTALDLLKQPTRTAAVTISDSTDVTATCTKGVWVGTAGDLAVKGSGDSSANTLKNVPSGTFVPGALARVMSTNTTASNIVCFYGP